MGKPSFKENKAYKMGPLMQSKEFGNLASGVMKMQNEFNSGKFNATMGFDAAGNYSESVDNDDMMAIFEEVYSIKEDLKAFVMSK